MSSEWHAKHDSAIAAFREFASNRQFDLCRLVHYSGVDVPIAQDVPLRDMERQITIWLGQGYVVRWAAKAERLYLAVQEPDCLFPPWENVFAESALADVAKLLREAGFKDEV
jgi:hypothetical protein